MRQLKVATLNPGRTGLAALGTNELLVWRLYAIGAVLHDQGVKLCVLPGVRFPPGSRLPERFEYSWIGMQTLSCAGVGMLVHSSIEDSLVTLEDVGSERTLWAFLPDSPNQMTSRGVVICGFYAKPGGDVDTWSQIIREYKALRAKFPDAISTSWGTATSTYPT